MKIAVTEAGTRLSVSGHEVRRLVRTGQLPARRVGAALLIGVEAVRLRARTGLLRALPVALKQIRFEEGVVLSGVEALGREQLLTGGVMEFYSVV